MSNRSRWASRLASAAMCAVVVACTESQAGAPNTKERDGSTPPDASRDSDPGRDATPDANQRDERPNEASPNRDARPNDASPDPDAPTDASQEPRDVIVAPVDAQEAGRTILTFDTLDDFWKLEFSTSEPSFEGPAVWAYMPGPPPYLLQSTKVWAGSQADPGGAFAVLPQSIMNVAVDARVWSRVNGGLAGEGGVVARFRDPTQHYVFFYSARWRHWELGQRRAGIYTSLACSGRCPSTPTAPDLMLVHNAGHTYRLEVTSGPAGGDDVRAYFNGALAASVHVADSLPAGRAGVFCSTLLDASFDSISVERIFAVNPGG